MSRFFLVIIIEMHFNKKRRSLNVYDFLLDVDMKVVHALKVFYFFLVLSSSSLLLTVKMIFQRPLVFFPSALRTKKSFKFTFLQLIVISINSRVDRWSWWWTSRTSNLIKTRCDLSVCCFHFLLQKNVTCLTVNSTIGTSNAGTSLRLTFKCLFSQANSTFLLQISHYIFYSSELR